MAKARILVVEDELIIAKDIQRTLIRLGYEVPALLTSAEAALEQVAALQPDLVLMDIHLSGEMDGITAADQIRLRNGLPVVYMTAYSDEATLSRARITEPYGYVIKPFEDRELKIAIDIALYRHATEMKIRHLEQIQAEKDRSAKLVLEAKNAELDRFAYTVSHDLKSPLVTIDGFLGFLRKDIADGDLERVQNDIQYIDGAVKKMRGLVTGLLELSQAGLIVEAPQAISLGELAHEAIQLLHGPLTARGAQALIQAGLPIVLGDKIRLGQVLQNLVENAIKYSGNQKEPLIEIGLQGEDGPSRLIFFVRDNGIGIPSEHSERIFRPFSQLHSSSEGSGVGLATVKRIIEAHGGRIWVESDPGEGSTFFFTLPPFGTAGV